MKRGGGIGAVALGVMGSMLVALGALLARFVAPEFQMRAAWGWAASLPPVAGRIGLLAGIAELTAAFALLRRWPARLDPHAVAALWYLPLLLVPPVLSRDMYSYADQGWMAGHVDPYATGMGTVGPFAGLVDEFWRGTTTVYPPLALEVERLMVALGGGDVVATVLLMRLPVLISLTVISWLLPVVARRVGQGGADPQRIRWLALLNPLTVVHLVGGGHNDAVMVALMVAAVALATTRAGYLTGSIAAGLAMVAKQPGLLAAVPVALIALPARNWATRFLAGAGAVLIGLATFALVSVATFGFGWVGGGGAPTTVETQSPACLVSLVVAAATGLEFRATYGALLPLSLAGLVIALVILWLRHHAEPLMFLALALFAFAVLGPGLQPWYLTYGLTFAAVAVLARRTCLLAAGWAAQVVVGNYLAEAWGMLTLTSLVVSVPVALAVMMAVHLRARETVLAAQ